MKKFALLCSALISTSVFASSIEFGTGEDADCEIARALAVNNALERFSEKEFEVNKKQICRERNAEGIDCQYSKEIATEVAGTLKKVLKEKVKENRHQCVVEVKVEIEKARPFFGQVKAKEVITAGKKFDFEVFTQEPLYVYVFNIHNNQISMLFPISNKGNIVDGRMELPENISFLATLPPQTNESKETLMVVFTKHKITFKRPMTKQDVYTTVASIPAYSRKIVYHNFVIQRR